MTACDEIETKCFRIVFAKRKISNFKMSLLWASFASMSAVSRLQPFQYTYIYIQKQLRLTIAEAIIKCSCAILASSVAV